MLSLYRKKRSNYKVSSEPVTITNKAASDEMEQQSSQAEKQQPVQQNIYDYPAPGDSLTIKNSNVSSTAMTVQIEMQKVQQ